MLSVIYAERHFAMSVILSGIYAVSFMPSFIYAECHKSPFMLSVIRLSDVMLKVMAPKIRLNHSSVDHLDQVGSL